MCGHSQSASRVGAMVALVSAAVALTGSCGGAPSSSGDPVGLGRWEGPPPPPPHAPPRCRWFNTRWAVYFRPGSAAIEPDFQPEPTGDPLLHVLRDHRSGAFERVRVVGFVEHYCPSAPSDEALARERGLAVIERLVEVGVPRDAIESTPVTIAACCIDADDACDPDVPHALRIVEINYWRCEDYADASRFASAVRAASSRPTATPSGPDDTTPSGRAGDRRAGYDRGRRAADRCISGERLLSTDGPHRTRVR